MSSILKALQKLETSHPDQVKFQSLTSAGPDAHRRRRRLWAALGIAALIAAAGMIGRGWLFERFNRLPEKTVRPAATAGMSDADRKTQRQNAEPAAGTSSPVPPPVPARKPFPPQPSAAKRQTSAGDSQRKPGPPAAPGPTAGADLSGKTAQSLPNPVQPGLERPLAAVPATNGPIGKPAAHQNRAVPPPPTAAPDARRRRPADPDIQPLDDQGLALQAISWSPVPGERLAVINNGIIHENEAIDGYRLVAIGQDSVILGKNGQKWRLSFPLQ